MKKIIMTIVLAMSATSFADQCAYITKSQAQKALKIVLEAEEISTLCEPCGEKYAESLNIKSVGISDVNYNGLWHLLANGEELDLAYTFVNGLNLSKLVGCESSRVSSSIRND